MVCDPLLLTLWGEWRAFTAQLRAGNTPYVNCQHQPWILSPHSHMGHPHCPGSPHTPSSYLHFSRVSAPSSSHQQMTHTPIFSRETTARCLMGPRKGRIPEVDETVLCLILLRPGPNDFQSRVKQENTCGKAYRRSVWSLERNSGHDRGHSCRKRCVMLERVMPCRKTLRTLNQKEM